MDGCVGVVLVKCIDLCCIFFFFQAEDGIRDWSVTGVQTCALPIWRQPKGGPWAPVSYTQQRHVVGKRDFMAASAEICEIGRASCRERV